jgi:hypothetical protein
MWIAAILGGMERVSPVAVAMLVVVGTLAFVPVASVAASVPGSVQTATNQTNASVAPGEQLAGVLGVQRAALESEVSARAFEFQVARAGSNASKARVVGAQVSDLEGRLSNLTEQREELREAYRNGSITRGEYHARLAKLHAEVRATERLTNQTEATARGLPESVLKANGVNVTAIKTLRTNAHNLTGPEVAGIARSIAGKQVGAGGGPPAFVENKTGGPPVSVENRTGRPAENETGRPDDAGPPDAESGESSKNGTGAPGAERGQGSENETRGQPGVGNNDTGPGNGGAGPGESGEAGERGGPGDSGGNAVTPGTNQTGPDGGESGADDEAGGGNGNSGEGGAPDIGRHLVSPSVSLSERTR